MLKRKTLGWAFWVNKLTYQQYLFYFREVGFFVTHERLYQAHFDRAVYEANEQRLGLYPEWDLGTDFFEVLLEFDPATPKQRIPDPVYRLRPPARVPERPRGPRAGRSAWRGLRWLRR
jgi:hypothetical protein